MQWLTVCSVEDLQDGLGVCALVDGQQVAIFYMADTGNTNPGLYAIDNYDPFGKANVLSRGLVGDIKGQPVVASPLYKQHFNLQTGGCLEDDSVSVPVYACRIDNGKVQIETQLKEAVL
jgi:nitrite reductase (NADH) small subunit